MVCMSVVVSMGRTGEVRRERGIEHREECERGKEILLCGLSGRCCRNDELLWVMRRRLRTCSGRRAVDRLQCDRRRERESLGKPSVEKANGGTSGSSKSLRPSHGNCRSLMSTSDLPVHGRSSCTAGIVVDGSALMGGNRSPGFGWVLSKDGVVRAR